MPLDIFFKTNKKGGGLFNYTVPVIKKHTKMRGGSASSPNKTLPTVAVDHPKKHSMFVGAKLSEHLDKRRHESRK